MIFIGTSGWLYPWNPKKNLDWYVKYSGFNAVELNASFYRIPTPQQVEKWRKYEITWAVKVNRKITHLTSSPPWKGRGFPSRGLIVPTIDSGLHLSSGGQSSGSENHSHLKGDFHCQALVP